MRGVKEEVTFVDIYQKSGIDERIDFLIEHYTDLLLMLDAFEVGLINNIKRERRYNRSAEKGDVGVRIQTSGLPDPTGNEGTTNADLKTFIREGDYMAALKGTDNFMKYRAQIITMLDMREDYAVVNAAVNFIKKKHGLYVKHLLGENSIASAAEAEGVTEEAIKSRFYRSKLVLIKVTKDCMQTNYNYSLLKKGA